MYVNSFYDIDYIKDYMIIKTGNLPMVSKIFEVAVYDETMFSLIELWWDLHSDDCGEWILDEMEYYILEADQNARSC